MAKNSSSTAQKRQQAKIKEYKRKLKFLTKIGAYETQSESLTRKVKSNINAAYKKFGQYDDPKFLVVKPTKEKRDNSKILRQARELDMVTTKRAILIEKQGQRRATIKKNRKTGEFEIHLRGKVLRGTHKGRKIDTNIPLAPLSAIGDAKQKLRDMAHELGPLGPHDKLTFKVVEGGHTGYSHNVFGDIESLLRKLEQYEKSKPAMLNFFRHIIVEKTTTAEFLRERKRRRDETNQRKQRRHPRRGPRRTRD